MPIPQPLAQLKQRRDQIRRDLTAVGDFRPGSLQRVYRKCGKPNCHCAQPHSGGMGPMEPGAGGQGQDDLS